MNDLKVVYVNEEGKITDIKDISEVTDEELSQLEASRLLQSSEHVFTKLMGESESNARKLLTHIEADLIWEPKD